MYVRMCVCESNVYGVCVFCVRCVCVGVCVCMVCMHCVCVGVYVSV